MGAGRGPGLLSVRVRPWGRGLRSLSGRRAPVVVGPDHAARRSRRRRRCPPGWYRDHEDMPAILASPLLAGETLVLLEFPSAFGTEVSRWQGNSLTPGSPLSSGEGAWPKALWDSL